ncbi:unnamed protein product [Oppiella nova]|uniref:Nuclear receptor domain-containing protein n=1 Tax=Oppiella nova TaxID=334625 RepID=A0A7R9MAP5_9ACAR|nr:unnamed protein product [Oppiella nova]CAG2173924.1 unnamed protein product [Oppiella nova]
MYLKDIIIMQYVVSHDQLRCYLGGDCKIDFKSRKNCKKCRLNKCLAIGMRKELLQLNTAVENVTKTIEKPIGLNSDKLNSDITVLNIIIENNDSNGDKLRKQIQELESINTNVGVINTIENTHEKSATFVYKSVFKQIYCDKSFNDLESIRLTELLKASKIFNYKSFRTQTIIEFKSISEVNNVANLMMDNDTVDLIQFTKHLDSFNNLCFNDQMALFKYGCLEILILRSSLHFDINTENWMMVWNSHNPSAGVTAIILFNPNRPNLIHRDVVKSEQQLYIYLLQRYLFQ